MGKRTYTKEHDAFLKHHPILDRVILTALFNREFGEVRSVEQIRNHCRREIGLKMARTTTFKNPRNSKRFKKGEYAKGCEKTWFKPGCDHLTKGVGHEYVKDKTWLMIKATNEHGISRRNYRKKHIWTWEQHHGKVPAGMVVSFKDNNRMNCDIENLMLIPFGEFMRLCRVYGWQNEKPELKPIVRTIAAIDTKLKTLKP